jgi:membrane-associated phospholipid phosphatase
VGAEARTTGRRLLGLGLALALASLAPAAPSAAASPPVGPPPPEGPPAPAASSANGDGRRTIGRLPANLGRAFVGVFDRDNLAPLLIGGTATAASAALDENVQGSIDSRAWHDAFATAGSPLYTTVFVGGMFAAGRFAPGTRFRAMTYDMLDAFVVNAAYTEALKLAITRERPDGQDEKSFPSGHTSTAFALATVAERHYGWKVGVPAYALAGVMGASRVQQDKHYLSDVVAGATLGYIVGRTVERLNGRPLPAGRQATVSVTPILGRDVRGMRVSVVF